MRRKHVPLILLISATAIALIATTVSQPQVRIVWNATPSVDIGLYWIAHAPPSRDELAAVRLPPALANLADRRQFLPLGALLLKPVAAIRGDRVCRRGHHILINNELRARASDYDARRRRLPKWSGCRVLGPREVFFLSSRPDSFDGRHFGVLAADLIVGRAIPLLTF